MKHPRSDLPTAYPSIEKYKIIVFLRQTGYRSHTSVFKPRIFALWAGDVHFEWFMCSRLFAFRMNNNKLKIKLGPNSTFRTSVECSCFPENFGVHY